MQNHDDFMLEALKEARKAAKIDEVPIGAVIVLDGKIIARGHNLREKNNDPTAHAEILALRKASKKLASWRLPECTMYVTLEPCAMCAGAMLWSRMKLVVFGAYDEKGGSLATSFKLYEQKGINHRPEVIGGVRQEECSSLLTNYFKMKRSKNKIEKGND